MQDEQAHRQRMMLFPPERRHHDADTALPLAIVRGVIATEVILVVGALLLESTGTKCPDWIGNAVIGFGGGLLGFLSRAPSTSRTPTVNTGPTENVTVGAAQTEGESA